jgi:peptide/nickel transport system permease protein
MDTPKVEQALGDVETPEDPRRGALGALGLWREGASLATYARRHPRFLFGLLITVLSIVLAMVAPLIVPYSPTSATVDVLQAPSLRHLMGTDPTGMDIFSRVLSALQIDLSVGVSGTILSLTVGVVLGAAAGYWGATRGVPLVLSEGLLRIMDMIQSFPVFIFALALVSLSGPSAQNLVLAIAFVNLPIFLRLTRASVLATREQLFVEAARSVGMGDWRILFRYIIPNSIEPALVNASVTVGAAILLTAGLSFIGAGIRPPTPEWGSIISTGSQYMITGQWWIAVFPGLALSLSVFGFALLGDGLREYLDPTKRHTFDRHVAREQ